MLVMVRTCCCESYKSCGSFCAVCPYRLENQEALAETQRVLEGECCQGVCTRAHRRRALVETVSQAAPVTRRSRLPADAPAVGSLVGILPSAVDA